MCKDMKMLIVRVKLFVYVCVYDIVYIYDYVAEQLMCLGRPAVWRRFMMAN